MNILLMLILGLVIGSFLNVIIVRLPIMLFRRDGIEQFNVPKVFNLFVPRSMCCLCYKALPIYALIPVLSFIFLRGKCIYCRQYYGVQSLIVELLTAFLFVIITIYFSSYSNYHLVLLLFSVSIIIVLMFIDYNHFILPDSLTLLLLATSLLLNLHGNTVVYSLRNSVLGMLVGYSMLFIINYVCSSLLKQDAIGQGDIKFFAALLALVGVNSFAILLLFSSFMGIIYFIIFFFLGRIKYQDHIPFGFFLGAAGIFVLLFYKYLVIQYI